MPGHPALTNRTPLIRCLLLGVSLLFLSTCGDSPNGATGSETVALGGGANSSAAAFTIETLTDPQQRAVRELTQLYLDQAEADFVTLRSQLQDLNNSVASFLEAPATETLEAVQEAWLAAHNAYEATLLHRYFAELVLPQQTYLELVGLNYRLNQWPIFPGYVDAVENYPDSGLVFDPSVALNRETLLEIHGQFDLAEAAMGFHVVEFLLWGESPALRSAADFTAMTSLNSEQAESGLTIEQLPNNRRRQLLQLTVESLMIDSEATYQIWSQGIGNYRQRVSNLNASTVISQLLTAVNGMLTEEFLVRSLYPLLNGNYRDSLQSRFSGAAQHSVIVQLASVERLLLDTVTPQNVRFDTLFSELSADFNELFYQNFDASKECVVLLYSNVSEPQTTQAAMTAEFEIVECINLLTNMIDHFAQIDRQLQGTRTYGSPIRP